EMPLGTLGTRVGPFMSSTNPLRITVRGRGGHAAMPHQCVDPVVVAAQLVVALQTVVSRNIAMTDSAVVSVTRVQAGSATNIIPETAELAGTVRTLNMATRATIVRRIGELAQGIAGAYGATAEATVEEGYPVLVNDAVAVERALATARRLGFTEDQLLTLPAQGGGEDFAYYLQQVPGAFLFLGARNEAKGCKYPHHHAHFDIDEAVLPLGVALLTQLALDAETER
ncbi:MAG TPA: amidohydrolase, partial [Phycisphaerae bacterium]|nr:amidohydrolase [Phycisphaerae bacterium]